MSLNDLKILRTAASAVLYINTLNFILRNLKYYIKLQKN